jgi:hypothetical protein
VKCIVGSCSIDSEEVIHSIKDVQQGGIGLNLKACRTKIISNAKKLF